MKQPTHRLAPLALAGALALALAACKKDQTTPPPDGGATTAGDPAASDPAPAGVPQEPDPPAIAEARAQVLRGDFQPAAAALQPLLDDLKRREQLRASGLAAAWLALAVVHDVAENAHQPAEHALAMAERTGDKEVQVAAKIAFGAYNLGIEHLPEAAQALEEAYKLDGQGPNAALALVYFGEAKIAMAFDGDDKIANPGELDTAAGTFRKAKDLAAGQAGNEVLAARATVGLAAVARYKNDAGNACDLINEALAGYGSAGAAVYLTDGAQALKDAANCQAKAAPKADPKKKK